MASSSSDASSSGAASDVAEIEAKVFVDPRELARSYEFRDSLITVGRIHQMESLGYFAEGSTREMGEEIVPKPNSDEAIAIEDFFTVVLRMPPHRVLIEILLKFRVQLHQLTPNAIVQMSKYFWVVLSFGGEPSSDGFAKRYELHYQPKKDPVDGFNKYQQFDIVNFHGIGAVRQGSFQLRRLNGQPGGQRPGSIARCPCIPVHVVGKPFTPSAHT
jgi:hypothetical protein